MVDLDDDIPSLCSLLFMIYLLFCDSINSQESELKKRVSSSSKPKKNVERSYKRHRKKSGKNDTIGDGMSCLNPFLTSESNISVRDFESASQDNENGIEGAQAFLFLLFTILSYNKWFIPARKQDNDVNIFADNDQKIEYDGESDENKKDTDDEIPAATTSGYFSCPSQHSVSKVRPSVNNKNEEFFLGYGSKSYKRKKKKQFWNRLVDIIGWHVDTFTSYIVLPLLRQNDYSHYFHRLGSFWCFPRTVNVLGLTLRLARSGFYYTGDGRTNDVTCYFCNLNINWNEDDDPEVKHNELSPLCPRTKDAHEDQCSLGAAGGLPTPTAATNGAQRAVRFENSSDPERRDNRCSRQTCHSSQAGQRRTDTVRVTISLRRQHQRLADDELTDTSLTGCHQQGAKFYPSPLGICREQPMFQNFSTLYQRESSFGARFPIHQSPAQLAKAGFFYTGINDNVQCFFCGGGLRNWVLGDDPWVRHAQWFPHCVYLRMTKGDSFVMTISNLFSGNR